MSKYEYLLACSRYIELNPIRAKMFKAFGDYHWLSFGFKAAGKTDSLVEQAGYCRQERIYGQDSEDIEEGYWFSIKRKT